MHSSHRSSSKGKEIMNISILTHQPKLISPTKLSVSPESSTPNGNSTTDDAKESLNGEEYSSSTSKQLLHNKPEKDHLIYCIEEALKILEEFQGSSTSSVDATTSSNTSRQEQEMCKQLEKDLEYIKEAMLKLREFQDHVDTVIGNLAVSKSGSSIIEQLSSLHSQLWNTLLQQKIPSLHKILSGILLPHPLQQKIPSLHKILSGILLPHPHRLSRAPEETDFHDAAGNEEKFIDLDIPESREVLLQSSMFSELEQKFKSLPYNEQHCLLCFSVFPEKAVIKKKVLMYWWIGEGRVESDNALVESEGILKKLVSDGFIEHVYEKRKLKSHGYKMQTFVRPVLTHLATETGFIEFDSKDEPTTAETSKATQCGSRLCLVKSSGLGPSQSQQQQQLLKISSSYLGNVRTLFNINERSLNLRRDWFSKLKNVEVLQLGTWQQSSSTNHHVEVEDSEFLKGLKKMKKLRYLSFQGISGITKLPSSSCIKGLKQLTVLDFSACPHIVELPDAISFLTNLTYLDLSQCYLLRYIPKAVSSLRHLQVLKGFLITDQAVHGVDMCKLQNLTDLKELRKLSIHIDQRRVETTTTIIDSKSLVDIKSLRKLMLMWLRVPEPPSKEDERGESEGSSTTGPSLLTRKLMLMWQRLRKQKSVSDKRGELEKSRTKDPSLLAHPGLEKLDLRGFPGSELVTWLLPGEDQRKCSLKKMYIRGGNLIVLGKNKWTSVEILHLKYLNELHLNWRQLQESFPSLNYFEKVRCPKLAFFPCDKLGVWQKNRDYYY